MNTNWVALIGTYTNEDNKIVFHGNLKTRKGADDEDIEYAEIGNLIFPDLFDEGFILCDIEFQEISRYSSFGVILNYYNVDGKPNMIVAALNSVNLLFEIRHFDGDKWNFIAGNGDGSNLYNTNKYHIEIYRKGSLLNLNVNGVHVLTISLNFQLYKNHVGLWCRDKNKIFVNEFMALPERAQAFVAMQFGSEFDSIYEEVIKSVCEDSQLEAIRADESYSNGIILSDIIKYIEESRLIIAEITPNNANVYYELGYAHALNKPTILLAEKGTKLPFDISPYRVVFYENTIHGKSAIIEKLRKHINEILKQ